MKIYAMSDIHGCLTEFIDALSMIDLSGENMLILLGDYVHGPDSYGVLDKIISLQRRYGEDKVVALLGNHEEMVADGRWPIGGYDAEENSLDDNYYDWMCSLPRYYATDTQIFCHAGVNEEAGELWESETDDYTYNNKDIPDLGSFCMDVIAGHIHTAIVADNSHFNEIYFDGESHYYIDGDVLDTGVIPVLMYDTDTSTYYSVTENGEYPVEPYDGEY